MPVIAGDPSVYQRGWGHRGEKKEGCLDLGSNASIRERVVWSELVMVGKRERTCVQVLEFGV